MRVMVLGLRGFPGIQGGVETHAEQLYPRLRDKGCDIEVIVRSPYWRGESANGLPGIRFTQVWSPSSSGAEAFIHTFLGVLYAGLRRPDVLHIHAVGPALFVPLAKLLGLRVIVTHHGPDYDREKWGKAAKAVLRMGERLGVNFADACIVISNVISDLVKDKYGRESVCIPNGVEMPDSLGSAATPRELRLEPGRYVLNVSRVVPEKRHLDLIEAMKAARLPGWKLALVGDVSVDDAYTRQVLAAAAQSQEVVVTGFQTGQALAELYANAGLFVLPSTHEGLPIALLEALSYGLPSVASDIPANKEVGLASDQYFRVGDTGDLACCLRRVANAVRPSTYRAELQEWVRKKYDWDAIACSTLELYQLVCDRGGRAIAPAARPEIAPVEPETPHHGSTVER